MPGYVLHLTEAERFINFIEENERILHTIDDDWKEKFRWGNLLPDVVQNKKNSHFWRQEDLNNIIVLPDLSAFLTKYKLDISDPVMCGYFLHLYLDQRFFSEYFLEKITFCNSQGNEEVRADKIQYCQINKTNQMISIDELFSEEYLYGDYTKMNPYFIRSYQLRIPQNAAQVQFLAEEIADANLEKLQDDLEGYFSQDDVGYEETKVFSKNELESFLDRIAADAIKYFKFISSE